MVEDYGSSSTTDNRRIINRLLRDINELLAQHGKTVLDYDLPEIEDHGEDVALPREIQDEISIIIPQQDRDAFII